MWYLPEYWPTDDGVIPYKLFYMLLSALKNVEAVVELYTSRAVAHGYGMARAGKNPRVRQAQRTLIRRAYPQRLRPRPKNEDEDEDAETSTR